MKNSTKNITLAIILIFFVGTTIWSHYYHDSQREYSRMKLPATVVFENYNMIRVEDSNGDKFLFKSNDMLGNSIMNAYNVGDNIK